MKRLTAIIVLIILATSLVAQAGNRKHSHLIGGQNNHGKHGHYSGGFNYHPDRNKHQ